MVLRVGRLFISFSVASVEYLVHFQFHTIVQAQHRLTYIIDAFILHATTMHGCFGSGQQWVTIFTISTKDQYLWWRSLWFPHEMYFQRILGVLDNNMPSIKNIIYFYTNRATHLRVSSLCSHSFAKYRQEHLIEFCPKADLRKSIYQISFPPNRMFKYPHNQADPPPSLSTSQHPIWRKV